MKLPVREKVSVKKITPYENNPRVIPDEAIEAVKQSIQEYGYVQPIVVDSDNVIIAGHTRFEAVKALKHKTVDVFRVDLSKEDAAKYRLVDNRTHELTDWAHDKLVAELREWESEILEEHFPEMNLEIGKAEAYAVTDKDIEYGKEEASRVNPGKVHPLVEVHCPSCLGTFQVRAATLPGVTSLDIEDMINEQE